MPNLKQKMFERDRIDCPLTKFHKTGKLVRSDKLTKLNSIFENIANRFVGRVLYDITYDNDFSFQNLTATELLSSAIFVHPCNYTQRDKQILQASKVHSDIDVIDRILSQSKNLDKYQLIGRPFTPHLDALVMLPGSNIFDVLVDVDKVTEAVKNGAMVKPHPLTNASLFEHQKRLWGEKNVIPSQYSGWDLLNKSDVIYTLGNSEMGLYAAMLGKKVRSCEKFQVKRNPAYRPLFNIALNHKNPYQALNNVFSSFKSGIFFTWDDEEKIEQYLIYAKNSLESIKHDH